MRSRWFPLKLRGPQDRSTGAAGAREDEGQTRAPQYPYSLQYETIIAQGHERPTPAFGAPTLVWHVGIWPRRYMAETGEACDPHDTAGEKHAEAKAAFEVRRLRWVNQIQELLEALQQKGRHPEGGPPRGGAKGLKLVPPHDLQWKPTSDDPENFFKPVEIIEQGAVPFTLWWLDLSEAADSAALANAIRVCVHPEVTADYACISFYMDIGQRWNDVHDAIPDPKRGVRRNGLLQAVDNIRTICEHQFQPIQPGSAAAVDLPAMPETLHCPQGRTQHQLHEALCHDRNLLYVDVWEAFCEEMDCRLEDIAGARGDVFANFRGLVMSTNGLEDERTGQQPRGRETASPGTATFANFSRDKSFNADGAEANAVVKAFWPFIRRVTPRADYREFIACGVLSWRAIYITALGSSSQYVERQERVPSRTEEGEASIRVPKWLLADAEKSLAAPSEGGHFDSLVRPRKGRAGNNHPVRYLLLTKHEPHPRQIGRIAERINTMGTMRLYSLKDWSAIRNADPYIRILGQELDQITEDWGSNRELINELRTLKKVRGLKSELDRLKREGVDFEPSAETPTWTRARLGPIEDALPRYTPRKPTNFLIRFFLWARFFYNWKRYGELIRGMENDLVADIRHSALYEISNKIETGLIDISAKLDKLGFGAIGGLHFRLNRSAYYVREFHILLKTLEVTNIPSWVSYVQFVRRGLAPAFDYAASIGERLRAVRTRLLTITETIETSALVGQSAATRHNTAVLRQTTAFAIIFLVIYLARSQLLWVGGAIWREVYKRMPPSLLAQIDEIISRIQSILQ